MEWLPPRIPNPALLAITGAILAPPQSAGQTQLRQTLYQPGFNWQALVAFASAQNLLPPLIWSLRAKSLLPPTPRHLTPAQRENFLTTRLSSAYAPHEARQQNLRAQLTTILCAFTENKISVLTLKGARYLLAPPASWQSARPMRDIDLLIPAPQAANALRIMQSLGYQPDTPTGLTSHHLPELRKPGQHGVVELHTHALAPAGRAIFPTSLAWQTAIEAGPDPGPGQHGLIMPPAWQALHAMLHHQASDDGFTQRTLALKPLWEFSQLASRFSLAEWQTLSTHLQQSPSKAISDQLESSIQADRILLAQTNLERFRLVGNRSNGATMLASWCLQAAQIYGLILPATLTIPPAARQHLAACLHEAAEPEPKRRARFLRRQLQRGFSKPMLAERYNTPLANVGWRLKWRHAWFLLKRYRGQLKRRLLG